jgi:hypothetical protein
LTVGAVEALTGCVSSCRSMAVGADWVGRSVGRGGVAWP